VTISSTTSRWEYTGDGSNTDFAVNNKFFADSDLEVYEDGVLQTLTTHYTVSGAGNDAGGTVTFVSAPANNAEVTIIRNVPDTQTTDLPAAGAFPSTSVEDALDRRTVVSQQGDEALDRSLKFLSTDQNLPSPELPALSTIKGKALTFNSSTGAPEATAFADIDVGIDTALSSEAANDFLVYDGTNWANQTVSEVRTTLGVAQAVQDFADVASATTTDIGAASSRNVRITGTVTITGLGTADAGTFRRVRFAAALTLTHNGTSLILPGAANITTAANDTATFISLGSGNWICISYKRATGLPVAFVDEDDMSSDSAALVPSQQSVKAYVDASVVQEGGLLSTASGTSVSSSDLGVTTPTIIHMAFDQVSVSGTDDLLVQIGDAGGIETTGYESDGVSAASGGNGTVNSTAGFIIDISVAARAFSGTATLVKVTGNIWSFGYAGRTASGVAAVGGGRKELSAPLTQILLKPTGSDSFDGGQVRIRGQ